MESELQVSKKLVCKLFMLVKHIFETAHYADC